MTRENKAKIRELTPSERLKIVSKYEAGCSTAELAAEFGRHASTIRRTIKRYTSRHTIHSAPRSGRPKAVTPRQELMIRRVARTQPKIEYKALSEAATINTPDGTPQKPPSHSTLYRVLKKRKEREEKERKEKRA